MRTLLSAIAIATMAFILPAAAQDQASVDASGVIPSIDPSVRQCEIVAAENGEGPIAGACIAATKQLMDALQAVDDATSDQTITDFVVAIVPLIQDEVCDAADDEIARAIRLAAAEASSAEQTARLVEIADTIEACDGAVTAEIVPDPDPASAA